MTTTDPALTTVDPADPDEVGTNDASGLTEDLGMDPIQPDRYIEDPDHVPDPTAMYGIPLTRGMVPTTESLEHATPMFRDHKLAVEGVGPEDVPDDRYYLTPSQIEAAREVTDGTSSADLGVQRPSDNSAITGTTNPAAASAMTSARRKQRKDADADALAKADAEAEGKTEEPTA